MKKLLTIFAVAALAATMTFSVAQGAGPKGGAGQGGPGQGRGPGQGGPGGGNREEMRKKFEAAKTKILTGLKLSKDQMSKLKAADDKQTAAMKKMRDSFKPGERPDQATMQKWRDTMQKSRKDHEDTYKKVMGDAKYKQYQEAMAKWAKDNGFRMGGGRGPGGQNGGKGGTGAGAGKTGGGKKPPLQ